MAHRIRGVTALGYPPPSTYLTVPRHGGSATGRGQTEVYYRGVRARKGLARLSVVSVCSRVVTVVSVVYRVMCRPACRCLLFVG